MTENGRRDTVLVAPARMALRPTVLVITAMALQVGASLLNQRNQKIENKIKNKALIQIIHKIEIYNFKIFHYLIMKRKNEKVL